MIKIHVSDAALISAYIQGEDKAFETLVKRSKSKVYTTIYLIVKDRYIAEDLMQEAYIKAIDVIKSGRYNEEGKFLPWILRISHNMAIDHFRKDKRYPTITSWRNARRSLDKRSSNALKRPQRRPEAPSRSVLEAECRTEETRR